MRSGRKRRYAALLLGLLLAVDASCCDEMMTTQQSSAHALTFTDPTSSGGVAQLDCHSCICSGLALIETAPRQAPPLQSSRLATSDRVEPTSESRAIDIPPDKRG